ncbi:MAG: biotin--[acetyl-CoA-carboxylase] ligase [Solirubrobacteraceae bacterium]|nr:biotin--[acetyl-CoA-carboxylase] ligase [Solirubrobacteraceae bacterium]
MSALGRPHLHYAEIASTNERARELAGAGAPHGTLVTAASQSAGRGRQGRSWEAPAGSSLLMSLVLREPSDLLPLAAGVAVARACGSEALVKWPNDVVVAGPDGGLLKLAGILAEGRPQEGWAVLGIGLNVAVRTEELPPELHGTAATLGLEPADVPGVRERVLAGLEEMLALEDAALLELWRERDALAGREVDCGEVFGVAAGVDGAGRQVLELAEGGQTAVDAGEVHLRSVG